MGIERCPSKERASHSGVDAGVAGARGTKAARIPVSINVTIDAASYREAPMGAMAHTFAGPAGLPAERGDAATMNAARFFHDVSQYDVGPLMPSKVSMVIICP
ncbi:hypothetical protein SAMN05216228_10917 [Rhizobium tibeticum]|uniref:Uncharacterized protein n=1 Tax=Rhizobium tibeticum TaxID=501024 RepID=A0ABY1AYP4_9HYPH|nr:hypothetical protein [Rhizobium tibeticum]SEP33673.1 hypothetical protein SAMN05216228_10917 [Rhizobium tibeticum]